MCKPKVLGFVAKRFHRYTTPSTLLYRVRQITFCLENALKKSTEYFLKFLLLFESAILPVNNEK